MRHKVFRSIVSVSVVFVLCIMALPLLLPPISDYKVYAAGEPVYQEFAEGKTASETTIDVDVSEFALSADDLLVGILVSDGKNETHTSPDGDTWNDILVSVTEGTNVTASCWWKSATGLETTLTFGCGSLEALYAVVLRITGHNSTPIDTNSTSATGDSDTATCPDILTQYDSELILRIVGTDHCDVTVDGGWASVTNISVDYSDTGNGSCAGGVGWANKTTQGQTGTETNILTAVEEWVAFTVGIRPPAEVALPTCTTQAATNVEDTTATGNGNITDTGGENCDDRGVVWDDATHGDPGNIAPTDSDYVTAGGGYTDEPGSHGIGAFTASMTGLPTGTTIYYRTWAHNSAGYDYGGEQSFLTKPAAPANVVATNGDFTDKVTITWTKSTGATDYHVWRDAVDLGSAGDVATFDDTGADAPTITPGTASATDGSSTTEVTLSLDGESANVGTTHTYKVVASNATGDSDDSLTDGGYRGVGALTYQWQRSPADVDELHENIAGATTDPYSDTAAPAPTITAGTGDASDGTSEDYVVLSVSGETGNNGDGRYYRCVLSATGAVQQTSTSDRGYRGTDVLSYQWRRSATDFDANFSDIVGATTDPYNDTDGVVDPDGRYYYAEVSMLGATTQDTTHDRGYKGEGEGEGGGNPGPLVDGEDPRDPNLVYFEFQPEIDHTEIVERGAPTQVYIGIFTGFSLPIWSDPTNLNEELYFNLCVPERWDGEHDLVVEVISALSNAGEAGNTYQLDLAWEKATPEVEVVPVTFHSESAQRLTVSNLQYYCYRDFFVVDFDTPVVDPIIPEDDLALRLRLGQVGGQYSDLDGELIILHVGVLFSRGDMLGEEDDMAEGIILIALVMLAVGLTVAMFATRQVMLGFPSLIMWAVLGAYAYTLSTTAWGDWQFYLFFASAFGMTIFCAMAMYGLRERRDTLGEEGMEKGEDKLIGDEEKGEDIDAFEETKPSKRTEDLRKRAEKRKQR